MNIVFTGGSGLLGSKLQPLFYHAEFPSSSDLDINDEYSIKHFFNHNYFDTLVHMAAYTGTHHIDKYEDSAMEAITTNIIATANLVKWCQKSEKKFIYISTDYVFSGETGDYKETDDLNPSNKYGWSKLGGECAVRLYDNSLIIRTSFCEDYFPYDNAFNDHVTSRLGVTECAKLIKEVIYKDLTGIIHIGGKTQTVYDLAKTLSPNKKITPNSILDIKDYNIPKNTSLNSQKFNQLFL